MTSIQQALEVPLPADVTEAGLLRYLDSRRADDGTISLPLHVALGDFGIQGGLALSHRVLVTAERRRDAENLNDEIAIRWTPGNDGFYPPFDGRITVWSEDRPDRCFIELRGTYEPPLSGTGELFDAAVGAAIARRTAKNFLLDLREGVLAVQRLNTKAL